MSKTAIGDSQQEQQPESVFECTFCANRYMSREIAYNELGYAICPVCQYEHGPE